MKIALIAMASVMCLLPFAQGQKLELKLDHIAAKASGTNEVDLDPGSLSLTKQLGHNKVPKEVEKTLAGMQEVHVRNYEFSAPGQYSAQDLEPLRKQVGPGTGWKRIVFVKEKNESVEVYAFSQQGDVFGLLVMAAEPRELTVVHTVGKLSEEQLTALVKSSVHYDLEKDLSAGR